MIASEKCRIRTCPCKGCPQVKVCLEGCIHCSKTEKTRNIGFCSIMSRDGQLLHQERKKSKEKKMEQM